MSETERQVVSSPGRLGGAFRIAGTSVPTSSIWNFHRWGKSAEDIVVEYPALTVEQVRAAIEFEKGRTDVERRLVSTGARNAYGQLADLVHDLHASQGVCREDIYAAIELMVEYSEDVLNGR